MADTIGSLAYKLKLDSQEFKQGMVATRAEFAAAKAIARESATGFDTFGRSISNLDVLLKKGLVNQAQYDAATEKLTRAHLENEAATRRLTAAEMTHLKAIRDAAAATKTTAQDEANRAKVMARGREIIDATRSAQDQLNRSLVEARKLYRQGAIDAATYSKHVADLKKNAAGSTMLGGVGAKTIGALGAITGGMSLIGVGKDAIQMSANVERATATMTAFTGSSAKAASMLDEMRKLSSVAGISFLQLNEGASAMLGYGVTAEETSKKLRQFAEMSRGDSDRFRAMALAFGQVNAAGRLMGQEVLQLINSGFNPLAEISRTTGIEFGTLKKMMENGQISIDMVSKAFDSATGAGGRFNGVMAEIGKTSAGALGRMGAEWEIFLDKLGKSGPTTEVSNAVSSNIHDASTMLSTRQDQVRRRMDDQRANPDYLQFADTGAELAEATRKGIGLDKRLQESQFYKEAQAHDKLMQEQREAKAKQDAEAKAKRQRTLDSVDALRSEQQNMRLSQIQKSDPASFKTFERATSLMGDAQKKQATADFERFGNVNRILPLLDRELQIELKKLDAMERQNELKKDPKKDAKANGKLEGPAKTAAGLTRDQHERTSYSSYDAAMQAERELQMGEEQRRKMMMQERQKNMVDMLPQLEQQRQQQVQAHSPAAAIAQGSQEAYKLMTANKTRADVKNDPQLKKLDSQITELKGLRDEMRKVGEKLDFEMVGG